MEARILRIITLLMLSLTIAVCFVLLNVTNLHVYALEKENDYYAKKLNASSVLSLLVQEYEGAEAESEGYVLLDKQLCLELPESVNAEDIIIENQYLYCTIQIQIPGVEDDYFDNYRMSGSSDSITDITFSAADGVGYITVELDSVYEPEITFDSSYLYVDFIDPHEIYDYIIVVDAGHGGSAPGATKQGVYEKDIDLAIVLELKEIFDTSEESIGVYYTRLEDTNPSLTSRVGLANNLGADLFLSIHNNSTASGRISSISGTEVMYYAGDETGNSKRFASILLENLLTELGSKSKGVVVGDSIFIIRESTVPVALVEVGFMTNKEELALLTSEEYQHQAALAMYNSILQALEEFSNE